MWSCAVYIITICDSLKLFLGGVMVSASVSRSEGPEFDSPKAHFSAEVEKVRPLAENPSKERRGGRRECTDAVLAPPLSRRSRNAPWPRKTRKRTRKMGEDAKKSERRDRFKTTKRAATHGRSRLQRQAHPRLATSIPRLADIKHNNIM